MKPINDLLTGKDNETHDIGRYSWLVSMVTVAGAAVSNVWHAGIVDLMQLAQAIGVIVVAHGGALFAKSKTEPDNNNSKNG